MFEVKLEIQKSERSHNRRTLQSFGVEILIESQNNDKNLMLTEFMNSRFDSVKTKYNYKFVTEWFLHLFSHKMFTFYFFFFFLYVHYSI